MYRMVDRNLDGRRRMTLTALEDQIVSSTAFREDLATHLKHAREGHVVTVMVTNGEPVAVLSRRLLAEQIRTTEELREDLEVDLDTIELLASGQAVGALQDAAVEVEQGGGLTPNEVRARLGWPKKVGS